MRTSNQIEMERFEKFCKELDGLKEKDPLRDVKSSSSQMLQIVSFHLMYEYLIEKWIDYKINNGKPVFSGIEKIGFHNKMYIAKNIGMPKELFSSLNKINDIRNKFAHTISAKVSEKEIKELCKIIDKVNLDNNKTDLLSTYDDTQNCWVRIDDTICPNIKFHLALSTLSAKLRNFVFIDIFESNSHPVKE